MRRFGKAGLVGGAMMIFALPATAQFEGLRLKAYLDPVGIPTICYGETDNVRMGDVKTKQECDTMLAVRLAWFGLQVERLLSRPVAPETHAAFTSFAYNVGVGQFARSSVLKRFNAGDLRGACQALTKYVYAGGRVLPGLVRRRAAERELCLKGDAHV